jgi:hypothetical protein
MTEILRVTSAEWAGGYRLSLRFSDGTSKVVDVRPLLNGPVFQPLQDEQFFSQGTLDKVCGTVVWPNGADFAPEALKSLEAETVSAT